MITILIPTFEEKNNLKIAVKELNKVLVSYNYCILFIDDNSNDGTYEILKKLKIENDNVNFIIREDLQNDLTESLKLGIENVKTEFTCIIDCDLQHDIQKIPKMIELLKQKEFDLIIGSRFYGNEKNNYEMSVNRIFISKLGILLSKILGIGNISDPLSGFFAFNTKKIQKIKSKIKTKGFKILLTILFLSKKELSFLEINTNFKKRLRGKSKLNLKNKYLFLLQIYTLLFKKTGSGGGI